MRGLLAITCGLRRAAAGGKFFRAHHHTGAGCVVCAAADPTITSSASLDSREYPSTTAGQVVKTAKRIRELGDRPVSSLPTAVSSSGTIAQWKEEGLRHWLATQQRPVVDYEALVEKLNTATSPLTEMEYEHLAAYFTSFTSIPTYKRTAKTNSNTRAQVQPGGDDKRESTRQRRVLAVDTKDVKQQKFLETLRDFAHAIAGAGVSNSAALSRLQASLFACCGTALGFHREGQFIDHDNDIDLGVFFDDLVAAGRQLRDRNAPSEGDAIEDASEALLAVLSAAALSERFVMLDMCGKVDKGLELRFQHVPTGVLLDLNVYYSPLPEDMNHVSVAPFVWCATHYENSAARKHGMYRYRHAPFAQQMQPVQIVSSSSSGSVAPAAVELLLPPQSYLVEYFGESWKTPRRYNYAEGLTGEYKNIIPE